MTAIAKSNLDYYPSFDRLNGEHPWMQIVPEGFVSYQVRELGVGQVTYFNFVLAKEMGLIPADHPHVMNEELAAKLVKTFSIQIINEYDELSQKRFAKEKIKPGRYMASRYLQLQHADKKGKTSGDGRGIWNGQIAFRGRTWDISSRGTGVTCLAPGAVEANRPLKTGGTEFGYGCGQAEIDELYACSIQAEILHLHGVSTERVLCIIDLGKGVGIGVRAAPNLFRPAHFFIYLKQNRLEELRKSIDYFMQCQEQNRIWTFKSKKQSDRYWEMAHKIAQDFAKFVAMLDVEYIFAWLDWDGDNVLANAGIIDYGSIRHLGIRHDRYRYDDVERYSTNLNEQRQKARQIVQAFVQIADYLATGKKTNIKKFLNHPVLEEFDLTFIKARQDRILYRLGFSAPQREKLSKETELFQAFDKEFSYFERAKVSGKQQKVADGVNHPALFNMSNIVKVLPEYYYKHGIDQDMPVEMFFQTIVSKFAKSKDAKLRDKHIEHIHRLQNLYKKLLSKCSNEASPQRLLPHIINRAIKINRDDKITGNALIQIVDQLLTASKRTLRPEHLQGIIDKIVFKFLNQPEVMHSKYYPKQDGPIDPHREQFINKLFSMAQDYREDI